ncbi:hypothetical protein [Vibrio cionasavignyae]|uniref:hypothetical protein n=1 Tax=Vibrio cionasavignyae TaxID=2910252 RepID=UPI003D113D6A
MDIHNAERYIGQCASLTLRVAYPPVSNNQVSHGSELTLFTDQNVVYRVKRY